MLNILLLKEVEHRCDTARVVRDPDEKETVVITEYICGKGAKQPFVQIQTISLLSIYFRTADTLIRPRGIYLDLGIM